MTPCYYGLIQWKIMLLMHHYETKLTLPMEVNNETSFVILHWTYFFNVHSNINSAPFFNVNTSINIVPSYAANSCLPLIVLNNSRGKEKAQLYTMSQETRDEKDNMHQEPYHIKMSNNWISKQPKVTYHERLWQMMQGLLLLYFICYVSQFVDNG